MEMRREMGIERERVMEMRRRMGDIEYKYRHKYKMSYRNEELLEKQKSNEIDTLNCTTVSCDVEPSSDWSK